MGHTRASWPRLAGVLLASAVALSIAQSVYRIPVQVSDSLDVILVSHHPPTSLALLREASTWSPTTFRPMRYLQARWLSSTADALGVSPHAVFRGVHAALAAAIVGLVAWIARPQRWTDLAALAFALTVLVGLHTFDAMMREAFPVNHYAQVAAASLVIVGAALGPPRRALQVLAVALLAFCLTLIESAALIAIVIVACAALGLPGIRRGTALVAVGVVAIFLLARWTLGIGAPSIGSHSSGWLAEVLSGDDLAARFSANPWPFYAYNVAGGLLSLVLSEPRFGYYQVLAAREAGAVNPVVVINIAASLVVTLLILARAIAAVRTRGADPNGERKVLAVGAIVIAASAALCATYIKDDIISTAGVFYAVMAFYAVRWAIDTAADHSSWPRAAVVCACLLAASSLWAFRAVGTHFELRKVAFITRNDWAIQDGTRLSGGDRAPAEDRVRAMRLRSDALRQAVTSPAFLPKWGDRYWIE